jgi:hypothetical protein
LSSVSRWKRLAQGEVTLKPKTFRKMRPIQVSSVKNIEGTTAERREEEERSK